MKFARDFMGQIKVDAEEIMSRLKKLQKDVNYIKEYIEDVTLTEDDLRSIEEAEKDYEEGRTISLEEMEKKLGI